jgi:8-oxo-dGTP pyrophosphatase MutT (NUDIX family)
VIQPWQKVESKALGDFRVFTLRVDKKISPRTAVPHDFYVIDSVPWVNVVATTGDNELVMIEQFRHGTNTVELEIPGGIMDKGDGDPVATGARELREETGYEGQNARLLGEVFPNPAIMSNTCYTILIEHCALKHPTQWDSGEDILTRLVPVAEIPNLIATNKIRHSLVLCALYFFDLWRRGNLGQFSAEAKDTKRK